MKFLLGIFFSLFLASCSHSDKSPGPLFNDLGNYHHPIATSSPLAQRYFDQGLVLLYSFEDGEAIRSFQAATKIDPHCAMCYWGLALALGSKTNMPLNGDELSQAKSAIKQASEWVDPQNNAEKFYIAALSHRYAAMSQEKLEKFAGLCSSFGQVTGNKAKDYANEMKNLILLLPNDPDAKTLYVAALFDLTNWDFWDIKKQPTTYTLEAIKTLEEVLAQNKNHPGANHYYVHIIEGSSYPERALSNAEKLSSLVPGSEHMAHMPCHTFYSLGRYHDSSIANQHAIQVYRNYINQTKEQGFEPEPQFLAFHNLDYLAIDASMEGRKTLAISTANQLQREVYPWVEKKRLSAKNVNTFNIDASAFWSVATNFKIA